jgi:citrate lyase subunit beta / citryl-CoA lyase
MSEGSSPRSYLFVPADRIDRVPKALATAADVVVIDLEDAVAPDSKDCARNALVSAGIDVARVMVRINGIGTRWIAEDIIAVKSVGVRDVMLPKAESGPAIATLAKQLGETIAITALVETALGVWNALEVAMTPPVTRLAFGSIDFVNDVEAGADTAATLYARSRLVLASRIAGLDAPVDGVTAAVHDDDTLTTEASFARQLGFGGKLCIHPTQIATVNRTFSPSAAEQEWARSVLLAAARSAGSAVAVDGQMVDLPVIKRAERIMRLSALRTSRNSHVKE